MEIKASLEMLLHCKWFSEQLPIYDVPPYQMLLCQRYSASCHSRKVVRRFCTRSKQNIVWKCCVMEMQ